MNDEHEQNTAELHDLLDGPGRLSVVQAEETVMQTDYKAEFEEFANYCDIHDFNTTEAPPQVWLVGEGKEGLIPARVVGLLVGASGVGKTRWLLELAVHVAAGRKFQRHPIKQGRVLMFVGEQDVASLHWRYKAIIEGHGFTEGERQDVEKNLFLFSVHGKPARLKRRGKERQFEHSEFYKCIKKLAQDFALISFDPLSRFYWGNLIDPTEATDFIEMMEALEQQGPTVIISHHVNQAGYTSKEQDQSEAKGTTSFTEGARFQIRLSALQGEWRRPENGEAVEKNDLGFYIKQKLAQANDMKPDAEGCQLRIAPGGHLYKLEDDERLIEKRDGGGNNARKKPDRKKVPADVSFDT